MIAAGLALLAIGSVDLVRRFATSRRIRAFALATAAVLMLAAGALLALMVDGNALVYAFVALVVAAAWWLVVPVESPRLWPVAVLGALSAVAVAVLPATPNVGSFGGAWTPPTPFDAVGLDTVVLLVGAGVFLLESANLVARAALRREMPALEPEDGPPPSPALKGGRLIGPLERLLVFALTLAGAYTLLAAVLAAKGIVRFPEISRDRATGDSAEYFLIGSLVSWVTALGAAFLVWWGSGGAL